MAKLVISWLGGQVWKQPPHVQKCVGLKILEFGENKDMPIQERSLVISAVFDRAAVQFLSTIHELSLERPSEDSEYPPD